ncbi:MAG: hypothetical protein JSV35_01340 [Candidatus Bathyarchaeota archaeon]|nr:MAG: hypothetical protein JSV35_01340 [Candidatus Bathyarchaeota archaeon]
MRTEPLALGIALLLVGVIVISWSLSPIETDEYDLVVREEDLAYEDWNTSAPFVAQDQLFVAFEGPGMDEPIPNGGDFDVRFWVNITDPQGDNSTFRVDFRREQTPIMNVTVEQRGTGLLIADPVGNWNDGPLSIGGVTQYDGVYKVHLYTWGAGIVYSIYPPDGILNYLEMYVVRVTIERPQMNYLPVGIMAGFAGAVIAVWALRTPTAKRTRKVQRTR